MQGCAPRHAPRTVLGMQPGLSSSIPPAFSLLFPPPLLPQAPFPFPPHPQGFVFPSLPICHLASGNHLHFPIASSPAPSCPRSGAVATPAPVNVRLLQDQFLSHTHALLKATAWERMPSHSRALLQHRSSAARRQTAQVIRLPGLSQGCRKSRAGTDPRGSLSPSPAPRSPPRAWPYSRVLSCTP